MSVVVKKWVFLLIVSSFTLTLLMTKITRYGLTGICICLALGSYLTFLADRDAKMFSTRTCESFTFHPDCPK